MTSASAYWPGKRSGRRGAMVRRLTRLHMGPWWTMQEAFGIVIFAVVGISVVLAVVSLFFRGNTYDQIGRGGSATTVRSAVRHRAADRSTSASATTRSARCSAPEMPAPPSAASPQLDVDEELARLTAPAVDPQLHEEARDLVIARNSRREARGEPPLDVDEEVERQLRELGG